MNDGERLGSVVDAVRRFASLGSACATPVAGAPSGDFTAAEARAVRSLGSAGSTSATGLADAVGFDAGYVSRLIRRLEERGLLSRARAVDDRRRQVLRLTDAGQRACAALEEETQARFAAALATAVDRVPETSRARLLDALQTVERIVDGNGVVHATRHPPASGLPAPAPAPDASPSGASAARRTPLGEVSLRPHRPGDMGWILHRHALLYGEEAGFGAGFELELEVAEVLTEIFHGFDPQRDHSWVAEADGRIVGSVFVVREEQGVARLRLLYVEPELRGRGLGARLMGQGLQFARAAGYERVVLWTTANLDAARRLFERAGFHRTAAVQEEAFGTEVTRETWEIALGD